MSKTRDLPTQFFIAGQWWSKWSVHALHFRQYLERTGCHTINNIPSLMPRIKNYSAELLHWLKPKTQTRYHWFLHVITGLKIQKFSLWKLTNLLKKYSFGTWTTPSDSSSLVSDFSSWRDSPFSTSGSLALSGSCSKIHLLILVYTCNISKLSAKSQPSQFMISLSMRGLQLGSRSAQDDKILYRK